MTFEAEIGNGSQTFNKNDNAVENSDDETLQCNILPKRKFLDLDESFILN